MTYRVGGIALAGGSRGDALPAPLSFGSPTHGRDVGQNEVGAPDNLQALSRLSDAFDGTSGWPGEVVPRWGLTDLDRHRPFGLARLACRPKGTASVYGGRVGFAVWVNRPPGTTQRRRLITMRSAAENQPDCPPCRRPGPILPVAFDLDAGFIDASAPAHRAPAFAKRLFQQRHALADPAVHAQMIDLNAPLGDALLKVMQTQRIRHIPAHAQPDHIA